MAKIGISNLKELGPEDETWFAKVKVLSEMIDHHIQEEEEQLFPALSQLLSEEELKDINNKYLPKKMEAI